jgi:hypothetical protein
MTAVSNLTDFQALNPFFRIIEKGVAGLVDGEHVFGLLAGAVDIPCRVPGGWPAAVRSPLRALLCRRPGRPAQPRSWRVTW